jgi:hypothetical protein
VFSIAAYGFAHCSMLYSGTADEGPSEIGTYIVSLVRGFHCIRVLEFEQTMHIDRLYV